MTDALALPTEEAQAAIEEFIQKNGLKDVFLRISPGSEKGDNFVCEIYKIEIASKQNKCVLHNLIMKTISDKAKYELLQSEIIFNTESYLYHVVLPTFKKFQNEHKIPIEEQFDFVKCYKADKNLVLMEDMCARGYRMHDRYNSYDSDHLDLVFISLARYHSISFAMKKLDPETYKKLSKSVYKSDICEKNFDPVLERSLFEATRVMNDASKAKKFISFSKTRVEKFHKYIATKSATPYDVICHGDCWNNNVLFKYENGKPVDMKFIDWQIARACSPVTDLSYMIYTGTDTLIRAKYNSRLFNVYYDALGKQLKYFGCDIEECYPRAIFDDNLKEFLPYGLMMSAILLPLVLSKYASMFCCKYSDKESLYLFTKALSPLNRNCVKVKGKNSKRLSQIEHQYIETNPHELPQSQSAKMIDVSALPTEETQAAIEEFIRRNGLKDVVLRISAGSEKGDNYIGEIYKIEIASKHDKCVLHNLIVKTTSDKGKTEVLKLDDLYNREAYLYNVVLPTFKKFQNEYNVPTEEQFDFVKCHKANTNLVLMEDMCARGYWMHDRYYPYDSDHLELTLINLARYHSISFALKKLDPETYKKLAKSVDKSVINDKYFDPIVERSLFVATTVMDNASKAEKLL
ncbi:uncharacterized protein LOC143917646 [Arctopsyche grandis]|uniref:uncharacterized protein LOC143917646 n=1 Tax=Arctopsyche grandis TaxID=121162 RepID=UPI00406D9785